jgi:hypothetical protein
LRRKAQGRGSLRGAERQAPKAVGGLRLPCHKHGGNHSRHARKRSASAGKGDR